MRYPVGAMVLTGAYLAGKLYEAKRAADHKKAQKLLKLEERSEKLALKLVERDDFKYAAALAEHDAAKLARREERVISLLNATL